MENDTVDSAKISSIADRGPSSTQAIASPSWHPSSALLNFHEDHQANWSPDGTHLVFTSQRNGREEIFLMDPDGTNLMRLATD